MKSIVLEDAFNPNANSFTFLRFMLAAMVILGHSYFVGGYGFDPLIAFRTGVAQLGVHGFFAISGFLVARSLVLSQSFWNYLWKRVLRIFPGFWVCLLLTACILAPGVYYFEHHGLARFSLPDNPFIRYVGRNALLFIKQNEINGIFLNNPHPGLLNGSLWTLFPEFICYIILPVMGSLLLFKERKRMLLWLFFTLVLVNSIEGEVLGYFSPAVSIGTLRSIFEFQLMFAHFLAGSVLFAYRKSVTLTTFQYVISLLLLVVALVARVYIYVGPLILAYVLIGLAIKLPLKSFEKYGDYSYGLYIYAFPVQQTLYCVNPGISSPFHFFVLSLICVFPFAWLSWHLVEKRFLALKKINLFPVSNRH